MNTKVPFFSMKAVNQGYDLIEVTRRVINSYWYVLGEEVSAFEAEFASYVGVSHCISLGSGTDALEMSLRALDVGPDDTVMLVANAGFYGTTAVRLCGAEPYYIDIDPLKRTMSPSALKEQISEKVKAVVVTHLYGQVADVEEIVAVADEYMVPVIEDCAQAHGAAVAGRRAGSFGKLSCFSFYPTKNLGAIGDGGAVLCNDESLAQRLKQLRQYGWVEKYNVGVAGGKNSRLDEIQAAVLRLKLKYLDEVNAVRVSIAARYNDAFSNLPLTLPELEEDSYVAHLYVVSCDNRSDLARRLKEKGVATDIHYPIPDHLQSAYSSDQKLGSLPFTEDSCNRVISLPCYPGMSEDEITAVISAVVSCFA